MSSHINQSNSINDEHYKEPGMNNHVIRESAFYNEIAESARTSNKCQFDLLLAMVSEDATDFDEFHQIQTPSNINDSDLYKNFEVSPKKIYQEPDHKRSLSQNERVQAKCFKDVQLDLMMNQEGLVIGNSVSDQMVFANTDYNTRVKNKDFYNRKSNKQPSETEVNNDAPKANIHDVLRPNSMDVDAWFKTLSQARSLDLVS